MRAVTLAGPGDLRVSTVAEPTLRVATDALVKVELTGVCGTDLHALHGHLPGIGAGVVLGHEFIGTVVDVGGLVSWVSLGDRVMSSDFTACGQCWYCTQGEHWHCPERRFFGTGQSFGPELSGAQAELVRVPFADTTLARIPQNVDPRIAMLATDNLATGYVAAKRLRLLPGEVVVVVGGGTVGQLAALSAQVLGAGVVVVSDPVPDRRRAAERRGSLATSPDRLRSLVDELTCGRGADAVVEAVGGSKGLDAALSVVRPGGRLVSVSAHNEKEWAFPLAESFAREIELGFAIGNSIATRHELFKLAAAGLLDQAASLVEVGQLDDAQRHYSDLVEMRSLKFALRP
jgi:alcohol dehydrogenase